MLDLDELQRLAEGATPSDGWFVLKFSNGTDVRARHVTGASTWIAECRTDAEAVYIAAMSPDTAKKLIAVATALELVRDCSSQEWQQADGKRMGATDNQGRRMWFISDDVMQAVRTALEELK